MALVLVAIGVGAALFLARPGGASADFGSRFPSALLDLQPSEHHESRPVTRRRTFEATRGLPGVTVTAPAFEVVPRVAGHEELMILLRQRGKKQIDIQGEYDPATFNRVILRVVAYGDEAARISFLRNGKEYLKTRTQILSGSREPSPLIFDLPQARNHPKSFDTLRVIIEGRSKPTALVSVDLINRPLDAWLPPTSSPAPIEVGLESRIAVGLSSFRPLVATTILPPSAELAFGFSQPRRLSSRDEGQLRVRVTVTQGDLAKTEEFALGGANEKDALWHSSVLPLNEFADRSARIRFELLSDGIGESMCAIASPVVFTPGQLPPTVLLITSDTHRADHLGSAISKFSLETPALDLLATRGVMFEQAYSSTNITNPSHIALMTATHPRDTGIVTNQVQLSGAAQTIAECYREAGYVTYASLCAKHLGHTTSGLGQGFDRMLRPKQPYTDAEVAIDHLADLLVGAQGRPLFVWLHLFDAHHPYGPPKTHDRLYWDKDTDPFDASLPSLELTDGVSAQSIFPPDLRELRDLDFPRAQYKAEITYLDSQLGRMFSWPRFSEALIAMTSDHGESFGEHDVFYDHAGAYPQNVHVPLILAGPSVPVNRRSDHPVRQIDIGRTLLNLSGLEEMNFPGRDLLSVIHDQSIPRRAQYTLSAHGFDASATFNRLHLVLQLREWQSTGLLNYEPCVTELYDLDSDPECTVDLWGVAEYTEPGMRLRNQLVEWLSSAQPTGWALKSAITAETQAELEALGYAGGNEGGESRAWYEACED